MIRMDHVYALSLAFMSGFMLGSLTIWRRQGPQQVTRRQSSRGSKRKSDVGKNVESSSASGAPVSPPGDAGGHQHDGGGHQQTMKGSRRSKRERKKRLCPKDLALDAFTKVARSHISCIGAGDYQSLLLLPRATFIQFGCFVPYASCRDSLVNLGQARTATASVDHLRILYVSCSWASTGDVQGSEDDFKTVRALLERSPDLAYVYVGRSCVASDKRQDVRAAQLRHVPLVLLRADTTLVLPRPTTSNDEEKRGISRPHSDINLHMRGAWSRMELAVGAVGQSKVLVVFRAPPFPETIWELKPGLTDVKEVAMKVVDAKETAAPGATNISSPPTTSRGSDENSEGKAVAAAAMKAACDAWLSSELNPLASLERARLAVAAAEDLAGAGLLHAIREMRPTPHSDVTEDLRKSLGEEHMAGETELAMSLLMFTVFCTQPKKRATYTDGFLEDTGKMEVVYRPIAVVRSPYKERFGTPRQPQVTAAVRHGGAQEGRIVFLKGHGYEEALQDVSGFEMIWVISHMHLNKGWNRQVRPPRLPEERKGLFSTRSPHRPNAVALSSLRVGRVDPAEGVIYVHGLDLLDGTPVLDVKPYIGYCDAFPDVKAGWLDALESDHEDQGDFLQKFSVGAALVHTANGDNSYNSSVVGKEAT